MTYNQTRVWLVSLLAFYLVGRGLQLEAGHLPNLLIVILHVVPAALFALAHGRQLFGWRGILMFFGLSLAVATLFESLSLRTGFPFGNYHFTALMGPKLFDLPILLALAYVGMGYLAWIVASAILGCWNQSPAGKNIFLLPLVASILMTSWDVVMDPVWADLDHGWVWHNGGPYFGVPISNYVGWLLNTYVFYQLFAWFMRKVVPSRAPVWFWKLAIAFYAASAAGNFLVIVPSSVGEVFIDATGKQWAMALPALLSRLLALASHARVGNALIDALASAVAFIHSVPVANGRLSQLPAEENDLALHDARKIEQADVEVLHLHAHGCDFGQRIGDGLVEFVAFGAEVRQGNNVEQHAAVKQHALIHLLEARIDFFAAFLSSISLAQQGFEDGQQLLCFGEREGSVCHGLLNLQHAIESYAGPVFHTVTDLDLVDHVAFHQVLKRPAQVLWRNSEHRGAEAAGVIQTQYHFIRS